MVLPPKGRFLKNSVITAMIFLSSSLLQPIFAQNEQTVTSVTAMPVGPAPAAATAPNGPPPPISASNASAPAPIETPDTGLTSPPPEVAAAENTTSQDLLNPNNFPSDQAPAIMTPPPSPPTAPKPLVGHLPLTYEQSKEVMLQSAPASPPTSDEDNEAFNNMMRQNMPLTPQQVVRLRQLIDTSQRAAAIPATIPPKPVSTTLMINLAPGATPPAIRLAQGYVTSLVFVDSTGAPWPLASYDAGDPKANTIQWDGKSNVLLIQAISPYSESNFVVRLVGLPTPITLELVSGQRVVDYRTDIHVSGIGPNSKDLPLGTGLPESANNLLLSVLDGVAPPGSKPLLVKGGDCQAWLLGDKMYVRTRFTVLSPGWVGKMVSPDGMYAYEIQKTSSILVSQYGEPVEIKVEGF